jgi:DNA (cytosine-5)-methyltransferase 1
MPDPSAVGHGQDRRARAAAIKAVAALPETAPLPNFGDLTQFRNWPDATVDLLVGGTPCQSFSVAGLRAGLDDPRGNLALVYLGVADRYRPRWVVWENVPGVLSSGKGRDFGAFLGGLGQLGYGWAYRVLDAQYVRTRLFSGAVPQRRRRVFVIGYLGDWRPAAAVLFDR